MSTSSSGRPAAPTRIEAPVATEEQCVSCGERNPAGTAFCVFCGTYLGWDEAGRGPTPQATPDRPPAPTPPPVPVDKGSAAPAPPPAPAPGPPSPAPRADPSAGTATHRVPPSPGTCPECGFANDPSRRFCGRCGHVLVGQTPPPRAAPTTYRLRRWWQFWGKPEERAARREYRRSLPRLYRWRRVIVTLAVLVGLVLVLMVLGRDPVGWVKDRWYDLRDTTVPIDGVEARATTGTGSPPAPMTAVVDSDPATAWTTTWKAESPAPACGQAESQGVVVLRWSDPTRVRKLQVDAGLQEGQNERGLEFRPATIDVSYREAGGSGDRECRTLTLRDTADRQTLDLDTEVAVRSLRISVSSVFDSKTPQVNGPVSIRKIVVRARPE